MIDHHGAVTTYGATDVADLGEDDRVLWPRLAPNVRRAGFAAVLAFPMPRPPTPGECAAGTVDPA